MASGECTDVQIGRHACSDQARWGKCNREWMKKDGQFFYCNQSCRRCGPSSSQKPTATAGTNDVYGCFESPQVFEMHETTRFINFLHGGRQQDNAVHVTSQSFTKVTTKITFTPNTAASTDTVCAYDVKLELDSAKEWASGATTYSSTNPRRLSPGAAYLEERTQNSPFLALVHKSGVVHLKYLKAPGDPVITDRVSDILDFIEDALEFDKGPQVSAPGQKTTKTFKVGSIGEAARAHKESITDKFRFHHLEEGDARPEDLEVTKEYKMEGTAQNPKYAKTVTFTPNGPKTRDTTYEVGRVILSETILGENKTPKLIMQRTLTETSIRRSVDLGPVNTAPWTDEPQTRGSGLAPATNAEPTASHPPPTTNAGDTETTSGQSESGQGSLEVSTVAHSMRTETLTVMARASDHQSSSSQILAFREKAAPPIPDAPDDRDVARFGTSMFRLDSISGVTQAIQAVRVKCGLNSEYIDLPIGGDDYEFCDFPEGQSMYVVAVSEPTRLGHVRAIGKATFTIPQDAFGAEEEVCTNVQLNTPPHLNQDGEMEHEEEHNNAQHGSGAQDTHPIGETSPSGQGDTHNGQQGPQSGQTEVGNANTQQAVHDEQQSGHHGQTTGLVGQDGQHGRKGRQSNTNFLEVLPNDGAGQGSVHSSQSNTPTAQQEGTSVGLPANSESGSLPTIRLCIMYDPPVDYHPEHTNGEGSQNNEQPGSQENNNQNNQVQVNSQADDEVSNLRSGTHSNVQGGSPQTQMEQTQNVGGSQNPETSNVQSHNINGGSNQVPSGFIELTDPPVHRRNVVGSSLTDPEHSKRGITFSIPLNNNANDFYPRDPSYPMRVRTKNTLYTSPGKYGVELKILMRGDMLGNPRNNQAPFEITIALEFEKKSDGSVKKSVKVSGNRRIRRAICEYISGHRCNFNGVMAQRDATRQRAPENPDPPRCGSLEWMRRGAGDYAFGFTVGRSNSRNGETPTPRNNGGGCVFGIRAGFPLGGIIRGSFTAKFALENTVKNIYLDFCNMAAANSHPATGDWFSVAWEPTVSFKASAVVMGEVGIGAPLEVGNHVCDNLQFSIGIGGGVEITIFTFGAHFSNHMNFDNGGTVPWSFSNYRSCSMGAIVLKLGPVNAFLAARVVMIDLQQSVYESPVIDLTSGWYSCFAGSACPNLQTGGGHVANTFNGAQCYIPPSITVESASRAIAGLGREYQSLINSLDDNLNVCYGTNIGEGRHTDTLPIGLNLRHIEDVALRVGALSLRTLPRNSVLSKFVELRSNQYRRDHPNRELTRGRQLRFRQGWALDRYRSFTGDFSCLSNDFFLSFLISPGDLQERERYMPGLFSRGTLEPASRGAIFYAYFKEMAIQTALMHLDPSCRGQCVFASGPNGEECLCACPGVNFEGGSCTMLNTRTLREILFIASSGITLERGTWDRMNAMAYMLHAYRHLLGQTRQQIFGSRVSRSSSLPTERVELTWVHNMVIMLRNIYRSVPNSQWHRYWSAVSTAISSSPSSPSVDGSTSTYRVQQSVDAVRSVTFPIPDSDPLVQLALAQLVHQPHLSPASFASALHINPSGMRCSVTSGGGSPVGGTQTVSLNGQSVQANHCQLREKEDYWRRNCIGDLLIQ